MNVREKNTISKMIKIRILQKNVGFENDIKSVPLYAMYCI